MIYPKLCNRCGNKIFMSELNGSWKPFDDQYATAYHRCTNTKTTLEEKYHALEKHVRKLDDRIQLQSESLRKLGVLE